MTRFDLEKILIKLFREEGFDIENDAGVPYGVVYYNDDELGFLAVKSFNIAAFANQLYNRLKPEVLKVDP